MQRVCKSPLQKYRAKQLTYTYIVLGAITLAVLKSASQTRFSGAESQPPLTRPASSCNCPPGDWPSLGRFKNDNLTMLRQNPSMRRVVFIGDSITERWIVERPSFFASHGFVDRGIYGQTTPQILLRIRADAIALSPEVVVILAGTNDLAGNTGPESIEYIEGNLAAMVEMCRANHLVVVLSSVLPVTDAYKPRTLTRKPTDILSLNRWMSQYCTNSSCVFVDYFNHMIDGQGHLRSDLTTDGVHPNPAGYAIMEPLAEDAVQLALHRKTRPRVQ